LNRKEVAEMRLQQEREDEELGFGRPRNEHDSAIAIRDLH